MTPELATRTAICRAGPISQLSGAELRDNFDQAVNLRFLRTRWMKQMIAGLLAVVFLPLSGPLFFCKCRAQMSTLVDLEPAAECCLASCHDAAVEAADACCEDSNAPCDEEVELAFTTPEHAGAQHLVAVPLPLDAVVPGSTMVGRAMLTVFAPRSSERDVHPPPGSSRLHLHFQILLI